MSLIWQVTPVGRLPGRRASTNLMFIIYHALKEALPSEITGRSMVIENASIVTPEGVLENASLKIEGGIIAAVSEGPLNGWTYG